MYQFCRIQFFQTYKNIFLHFYANILPHAASRSDTRENSTPPPLIVMPTRDLLDIFLLHIRKKWLNLLLVQ